MRQLELILNQQSVHEKEIIDINQLNIVIEMFPLK